VDEFLFKKKYNKNATRRNMARTKNYIKNGKNGVNKNKIK
jgi:hypothetical protein